MFPNRTFLYDREEDEIIPPENSAPYLLTADGEPVHPRPSTEGKVVWVGVEDRYIPLASTGLEDSEGNELIEGHIVQSERCLYVIKYELGKLWGAFDNGRLTIIEERGNKIVGHALITPPDLVPDSFDVEGYFQLEEEQA